MQVYHNIVAKPNSKTVVKMSQKTPIQRRSILVTSVFIPLTN